jgi:hypothetical protein
VFVSSTAACILKVRSRLDQSLDTTFLAVMIMIAVVGRRRVGRRYLHSAGRPAASWRAGFPIHLPIHSHSTPAPQIQLRFRYQSLWPVAEAQPWSGHNLNRRHQPLNLACPLFLTLVRQRCLANAFTLKDATHESGVMLPQELNPNSGL